MNSTAYHRVEHIRRAIEPFPTSADVAVHTDTAAVDGVAGIFKTFCILTVEVGSTLQQLIRDLQVLLALPDDECLPAARNRFEKLKNESTHLPPALRSFFDDVENQIVDVCVSQLASYVKY